METFKTLENEKYVPNTISNETVQLNFQPNDLGTLYATINWEPADGERKTLINFDLSIDFCNSHILLFSI